MSNGPRGDPPIPDLRTCGLFAMQKLERGVPSCGDRAVRGREARGVRALWDTTVAGDLPFGLGMLTYALPKELGWRQRPTVRPPEYEGRRLTISCMVRPSGRCPAGRFLNQTQGRG